MIFNSILWTKHHFESTKHLYLCTSILLTVWVAFSYFWVFAFVCYFFTIPNCLPVIPNRHYYFPHFVVVAVCGFSSTIFSLYHDILHLYTFCAFFTLLQKMTFTGHMEKSFCPKSLRLSFASLIDLVDWCVPICCTCTQQAPQLWMCEHTSTHHHVGLRKTNAIIVKNILLIIHKP